MGSHIHVEVTSEKLWSIKVNFITNDRELRESRLSDMAENGLKTKIGHMIFYFKATSNVKPYLSIPNQPLAMVNRYF